MFACFILYFCLISQPGWVSATSFRLTPICEFNCSAYRSDMLLIGWVTTLNHTLYKVMLHYSYRYSICRQSMLIYSYLLVVDSLLYLLQLSLALNCMLSVQSHCRANLLSTKNCINMATISFFIWFIIKNSYIQYHWTYNTCSCHFSNNILMRLHDNIKISMSFSLPLRRESWLCGCTTCRKSFPSSSLGVFASCPLAKKMWKKLWGFEINPWFQCGNHMKQWFLFYLCSTCPVFVGWVGVRCSSKASKERQNLPSKNTVPIKLSIDGRHPGFACNTPLEPGRNCSAPLSSVAERDQLVDIAMFMENVEICRDSYFVD